MIPEGGCARSGLRRPSEKGDAPVLSAENDEAPGVKVADVPRSPVAERGRTFVAFQNQKDRIADHPSGHGGSLPRTFPPPDIDVYLD
jgi:hypothetical protein